MERFPDSWVREGLCKVGTAVTSYLLLTKIDPI